MPKEKTVTVLTIVNSLPALRALSGMQMSANASYRIGRFLDLFEQEDKWYRRTYNQLIRKFGTLTDPKADKWSVSVSNQPAFNAADESLKKEEVVVPWEPLTLEQLGIDKLQPVILNTLKGFLISDPTEDAELKKQEDASRAFADRRNRREAAAKLLDEEEKRVELERLKLIGLSNDPGTIGGPTAKTEPVKPPAAVVADTNTPRQVANPQPDTPPAPEAPVALDATIASASERPAPEVPLDPAPNNENPAVG